MGKGKDDGLLGLLGGIAYAVVVVVVLCDLRRR